MIFIPFINMLRKIKAWFTDQPMSRDDIFLPLAKLPKETTQMKRDEIKQEPEWYEIAKQEIGVTEFPGGALHNEKIIRYHSVTSLKATTDEIPWCASFVSWCLEQAGYQSTKSARARDYLQYGEKLEEPTLGCIVVFTRDGGSGHVGFFVEHKGDEIKVLGGNQNNSVCYKDYPADRLLGYRLPTTIKLQGKLA